jgi:hypothetical protein
MPSFSLGRLHVSCGGTVLSYSQAHLLIYVLMAGEAGAAPRRCIRGLHVVEGSLVLRWILLVAEETWVFEVGHCARGVGLLHFGGWVGPGLPPRHLVVGALALQLWQVMEGLESGGRPHRLVSRLTVQQPLLLWQSTQRKLVDVFMVEGFHLAWEDIESGGVLNLWISYYLWVA